MGSEHGRRYISLIGCVDGRIDQSPTSRIANTPRCARSHPSPGPPLARMAVSFTIFINALCHHSLPSLRHIPLQRRDGKWQETKRSACSPRGNPVRMTRGGDDELLCGDMKARHVCSCEPCGATITHPPEATQAVAASEVVWIIRRAEGNSLRQMCGASGSTSQHPLAHRQHLFIAHHRE
ncbi:hypothetical protein EYF80_014994 [Liparis tanakae]|uniref:Uncharacterized protein n=1 Tax=Liparis tanakae TaxID=230148 RepID=A0A4Z2I9H4_9TELE|nr:hypothetical protein EYF80_014994 [Liparis tanakae]